jgi:hypothetical protein
VVSWRAALQIGKKNFKFSRADRTAQPTDLPDGLSGQFRVQCARKKYFAWRVGRNRFIDSAIPPHKRGVGETHPSSGHPSIFAKSPFEEGWITGSSSPVMTIPIGTLF